MQIGTLDSRKKLKTCIHTPIISVRADNVAMASLSKTLSDIFYYSLCTFGIRLFLVFWFWWYSWGFFCCTHYFHFPISCMQKRFSLNVNLSSGIAVYSYIWVCFWIEIISGSMLLGKSFYWRDFRLINGGLFESNKCSSKEKTAVKRWKSTYLI